MKKKNVLIAVLLLMVLSISNVKAQEWSTGLDIYSSYIWRGSKFGSGPAFQPSVDYSKGGFVIGAWGSISASRDEAAEMDLFVAYEFDFGLSIGVTDYYYPGTKYFDYSRETGAQAFEVNLEYGVGGFAIAGNVVLNEAGGAGSYGGDLYFEVGYGFKHVDVTLGAGDGWHTPTRDGKFNVVNIGVGTQKEIALSEKFSLPVSGSVILNPTTEQLYVVVGISL